MNVLWVGMILLAFAMSVKNIKWIWGLIYLAFFLCHIELIGPVRTPFGIAVCLSLPLALIQSGRKGSYPLLRTGMFAALMVFLLVCIGYWVAGHDDGGGAISLFMRNHILSVWPLFMLWGIRRPADTRWVMLSLMLASFAVCALVLVLLIVSGGGEVLVSDEGKSVREFASEVSQTQGGGFGFMGLINYPALITIAAVVPVIFGLAMDGVMKAVYRQIAWASVSICIVAIMFSSHSTPLLGVVIGCSIYLMLRHRRTIRTRGIFFLVLVLALGSFSVFKMGAVKRSVDRIRNPMEDGSGSYRIEELFDDPKAFLEAPVFGHGAVSSEVETPGGVLLRSHNSMTRDLALFGLVFCIPFWTILIMAHRLYRRLIQLTMHSPTDNAVVRGMLASMWTLILAGFASTTFGGMAQEIIFWTFVSIGLYWEWWLKRFPGSMLFWDGVGVAKPGLHIGVPSIVSDLKVRI